MSELATQRIGGYEVLDLVTTLDHCKVYRARCVVDNRAGVSKGETVALNVFNPMQEQSESCARFDRIAGMLLAFSHPHVVRYLDAFKWKDPAHPRKRVPCLAAEDVTGETLGHLMERTRKGLEPEALYPLWSQTLDGLRYVSQKSMLPRYFTPSHIMLTRDGSVKLLGFGAPRRSNNRSATVAGTDTSFQYLPPDFVNDEHFGDECSLVFSLGVCLYHATTGHLPFPRLTSRRDKGDCFRSLVSSYHTRWGGKESPRPLFVTEEFSACPDVQGVLERCFSPRRADRYPDLDALQAALEEPLRPLRPVEAPVVLARLGGTASEPVADEKPVPRWRAFRLNYSALGACVTVFLLLLGLVRLGSRFLYAKPALPPPQVALRSKAAIPPKQPTQAVPVPAVAEQVVEEPVAKGTTPERVDADLARDEEATPPEEAPPVGGALAQVYFEPPDDHGPPVQVAYRSDSDPAWVPAEGDVEVSPGRYTFKFTRLDYLPELREVEVKAGAKASFVSGPSAQQWKPRASLAVLKRVETAWEKKDFATVSGVLAKPTAPVFEWDGHTERYAALRHEWFQEVKRNRLARNLDSIAFVVDVETPPDGEDPVKVVYRRANSKRWSLLKGSVLVKAGEYEMRFIRPDYKMIGKSVKVVSGKDRYEVIGPRLSDWQPTPRLETLRELEQALEKGDIPFLTNHFAKPPTDPLKSPLHQRRLAKIRQEWYRRLLEK